jgi:hypothetical protein
MSRGHGTTSETTGLTDESEATTRETQLHSDRLSRFCALPRNIVAVVDRAFEMVLVDHGDEPFAVLNGEVVEIGHPRARLGPTYTNV